VCAFLERTQVGRAAIVAGLRRYAGRELQALTQMTVWRLENVFPQARPQPSASWRGY
jgi:hypothetical protein